MQRGRGEKMRPPHPFFELNLRELQMQQTRRWTAGLTMSLFVACRVADTVAPAGVPAASLPTATLTKVYPASQYTPTALLSDHGWFTDVNDRNLVVGTIWTYAVAMPLHGAVHPLPPGGSVESNANAVNTHGAIVGRGNLGTSLAPKWMPALWPDMTSTPIFAGIAGEAADNNDQGLIVGTGTRGTTTFAFVWDGVSAPVRLPFLPGGRSSYAVAISPDNVILGASDSPSGSTTVLWRQNGSGGWTPKAVSGGIAGRDIDTAYGIVGSTGSRASFGNPNHAGYFNTGAGEANAVSPSGVATGTDAAGSPGWPTYWVAFVADRAGNTTHLPDPTGGGLVRATNGFGINNCGVVVGSVWVLGGFYTTNPALWDPGC